MSRKKDSRNWDSQHWWLLRRTPAENWKPCKKKIQPIWDTTWSVAHREYAKNPALLHPLRYEYGPRITETSKLSWFQTHFQNNMSTNLYLLSIGNLESTFLLPATPRFPQTSYLWISSCRHHSTGHHWTGLSPRGLPFLRPGLNVDTLWSNETPPIGQSNLTKLEQPWICPWWGLRVPFLIHFPSQKNSKNYVVRWLIDVKCSG